MLPHCCPPAMGRHTRRRFLGGMSAVTGIGLAGCLGSAGSGGGTGIRLDTYDVAGSPGTTLPVLPEGEVALLDFWATWCAPCKPQMTELREVATAHPSLHLLSITNEDEPGAIRAFWREYEGTWPVASDPELRTNERFDVTRIPTLLLFDKEGTERWRHVGLAAAETILDRLAEAKR